MQKISEDGRVGLWRGADLREVYNFLKISIENALAFPHNFCIGESGSSTSALSYQVRRGVVT